MVYLNKKRKILFVEIAVVIGMLLAVIASFTGVVAQTEDIGNRILRLHILANSDSKQDQDLKLKVRDGILEKFSFDLNGDVETAKENIKDKIPEIEKVAQDVIKNEGFNYSVKAEVVNMYFNTRKYDKFTMPAGAYDALRITIGEASGHNWWCVLYPPLCVPAAESEKELNKTLNEEQTDLVEKSPSSDVRFAVVELWESLKNKMS